MTKHRFRFFVDSIPSVGDTIALRATDAQHLRVVRSEQGAPVEVVAADGTVFAGRTVGSGTVELTRLLHERDLLPEVWLFAGAMPGQRWDALLDGAVQAGVSYIVPIVQSAREREQMTARRDRVDRVVEAAAKQAKRSALPRVENPVDLGELREFAEPGVVLFEQPGSRMTEVLARDFGDRSRISLVVGPPAGLPVQVVHELVEAGWSAASLGPVVLRTELAAAVAVSCAVQVLAPAPANP